MAWKDFFRSTVDGFKKAGIADTLKKKKTCLQNLSNRQLQISEHVQCSRHLHSITNVNVLIAL